MRQATLQQAVVDPNNFYHPPYGGQEKSSIPPKLKSGKDTIDGVQNDDKATKGSFARNMTPSPPHIKKGRQ